MDIVYAAEKTSIARLLGEHTHRDIEPEDIRVAENPNETGSFFVGWQFENYVLLPDGRFEDKSLELID